MVVFNNPFEVTLPKKGLEEVATLFKAIKKEKKSKEVGYYTLPKKSQKLLIKLKKYKKKNSLFHKKCLKSIVIIGIGGSTLGTKAIYEALKHRNKSSIKLHFLENCDPVNIAQTLKAIKKESTLFMVISKSGTTIETISLFKYVLSAFNINLKENNEAKKCMIITDKHSALNHFATQYNIPQFFIPANVGGRFSVLSAVGIVPLYLLGFDVKALLEGAQAFKKSFFKQKETHVLHKAYSYYHEAKRLPMNVLFSYSSVLSYFNQWVVQLWGESLGKKNAAGDKVGLTPIGLVGSVDQHSFLQLIMQGPCDKTVTFLAVEEFNEKTEIPSLNLEFLHACDFVNGQQFSTLLNAQGEATKESLEEEGVRVDKITLLELNEKSMGMLMYYYELLTSCVGQLFEINTYDQPGVELGKIKLAKKFEKG